MSNSNKADAHEIEVLLKNIENTIEIIYDILARIRHREDYYNGNDEKGKDAQQ
jgi:hypothetical protein